MLFLGYKSQAVGRHAPIPATAGPLALEGNRLLLGHMCGAEACLVGAAEGRLQGRHRQRPLHSKSAQAAHGRVCQRNRTVAGLTRHTLEMHNEQVLGARVINEVDHAKQMSLLWCNLA